jgi:hypothetical protein
MGTIWGPILECIASTLDAIYHRKKNELVVEKSQSKEEMKKDIKEMKESIVKGDEALEKLIEEIQILSPKMKKACKDKLS